MCLAKSGCVKLIIHRTQLSTTLKQKATAEARSEPVDVQCGHAISCINAELTCARLAGGKGHWATRFTSGVYRLSLQTCCTSITILRFASGKWLSLQLFLKCTTTDYGVGCRLVKGGAWLHILLLLDYQPWKLHKGPANYGRAEILTPAFSKHEILGIGPQLGPT